MSRDASLLVVVLAGPAAMLVPACGRFGFEARDLGSSGAPPLDASGPDAPGAGADFTAGCAALFHMDEAAWIDHTSGGASPPGATDLGNACDPGNPGLASGGPAPIADPVRGRVGDFNDHSCVQLEDEAPARAATAVTASAWLNMTGDPTGAFGIVSKRADVDSGDAYNLLVWTDSRVFVDIDSRNDRFSSAAAVPTHAWTQITMVYDGASPAPERVRIYVNGALDRVGAESSAAIPPSDSPLSIGCLPLSRIAQSFVGQLDDVAVWTRAFTDREVAAWYDRTRR